MKGQPFDNGLLQVAEGIVQGQPAACNTWDSEEREQLAVTDTENG
jgi:hypothetical protein